MIAFFYLLFYYYYYIIFFLLFFLVTLIFAATTRRLPCRDLAQFYPLERRSIEEILLGRLLITLLGMGDYSSDEDVEKEELRRLFDTIDDDGSGHISKEEFIDAVHNNKVVKKFVSESTC